MKVIFLLSCFLAFMCMSFSNVYGLSFAWSNHFSIWNTYIGILILVSYYQIQG